MFKAGAVVQVQRALCNEALAAGFGSYHLFQLCAQSIPVRSPLSRQSEWAEAWWAVPTTSPPAPCSYGTCLTNPRAVLRFSTALATPTESLPANRSRL